MARPNADSVGRKYQVVGIGNAVVDVLSHVEEAFLAQHRIRKGIMQLVDLDRASELYGLMQDAEEVSGGSVANTIAGIARLGGRTAYIGKIVDDHLGRVFSEDMRAQGASFDTVPAAKSAPYESGRCMVFISPDGERSMNTYLGAAEHLSARDIDESAIASSEWLLLEGFRLDGVDSIEAYSRAISLSRKHGCQVALTLSDPACVERNRQAFVDLLADGIDLLLCNEAELKAMFAAPSLGESLRQASRQSSMVACTRGAKGTVLIDRGVVSEVPALKVQVVDATGAGDQFATGLFFGLVAGHNPVDACRLGSIAAAEVISHVGARPVADLGREFSERGLGLDGG